MPDTVTQHNIGAFIAPVTSVFPQSSTGGTINGPSIDLAAHSMPGSLVLHQHAGAVSGAPTTVSVQSKLQHAPDNATWADYTDPDTGAVAQTAALAAASSGNRINVDLSAANRYVRAVTVVAFTGGTSPAVLVAAEAILGGSSQLPAV